jgi:hypothetical protein
MNAYGIHAQRFPQACHVPVFRKSPVPGFFGTANPNPAMDKAAFISLNAPSDNIPHHKARGKDNKALAGDYIAENHTANGDGSAAYIAFHPGPFPNNYPALCFDIPLHIAVHAGKSTGFNIS